MKLHIKILFLLFNAMITISSFAQNKEGFKLSGHIDGLDDGVTIKLGNKFTDWHRMDWLDSCKVVGGNFHLTGGSVPEGPRMYEVMLHDAKNETLMVDGGYYSLYLSVQNGDDIKIQGHIKLEYHNGWVEAPIEQVNGLKITGSSSQDALLWEQQVSKYANHERSVISHKLNRIRDSIGFDYAEVEKLVKEKNTVAKRIDSACENASADKLQAIPELLWELNEFYAGYHGYFVKHLFEKLPESAKNSYYGKLVRNSSFLAVGQPFPDFKLPDSGGSKIASNAVIQKSKLTLVHFWATNSFDVGRYQRELKLLYKRYHPKGLAVIGVSADTSVGAWKDWLDSENYPWANVIAEPKGWMEGSLIKDVYNEGGHSIPNTTNVLVDQAGTIVAWDVDGPELQYYLEKYLGR